MSHRIRALVLIPLLFVFFSIQPFLKQFQQDGLDEAALPSPTILEQTLPTAFLEEIFPERSLEPTLIPDRSPEETDLAAAVGLLAPETVFIEASVQDTPTAVEEVINEQDTIRQLEVFSELWAAVNEIYLYPDFNGLDWLETRRQIRERIEAGLSFDEFYQDMERVVQSLGDEHSFFLTPEKVAAQEAKFAGNMNFAGIGVISKPVPDKGSSVILLTFPDGPADLAGLRPRDSILAVDGISILDENGAARDLLRGPEGTEILLTVQGPGEEIRQVSVRRGRISGPIPIPTSILTTIEGKRIGYMLLVSFADSTVEERIGEALLAMSAEGALDGLIIDNRFNEGGADRVLKGALSYFTDGLLGHFISRKAQTAFEVAAVDINRSQQLPLAVIVGPYTLSYGEIFSGILQDSGRAVLIGEPTRGNVETLSGHNFSDGSRAWIAYKAFRPANDPERDWEQQGVIPDVITSSNWDEYIFENDPAVISALQYIDIGDISFQH